MRLFPLFFTSNSFFISLNRKGLLYTHRNCATKFYCDQIEDHDLAIKYTISKSDIHPRLLHIVKRHFNCFQTYNDSMPFAQHTTNAFIEAQNFVNNFYKDADASTVKYVILDSGCGVGLSTIGLAREYLQYPVIGIDRSLHRLERSGQYSSKNSNVQELENGNEGSISYSSCTNLLLIRAELGDFWMLVCQLSDWVVHSHYILYPNPYPKNRHIQRRWHAHPSFPALLVLGGRLVVRSNWRVYCEEMRQALILGLSLQPYLTESVLISKDSSDNVCAIDNRVILEEETPISTGEESRDRKEFPPPTTRFEMKYRRVGLPLYQLDKQLGLRGQAERLKILSRMNFSELK